MGLYYCEEGIANRSTNVTYDRKFSNKRNRFDLITLKVLKDRTLSYIWHHTVYLKAMFTTLKALKLAKSMGLKVAVI